MARASKYTKELLGPIVATSQTFAEVIRRLGIPENGGNHRNITGRIRFLGIDTSHFRSDTIRARCEAIPRETLQDLVIESLSFAQVLIRLGFAPNGRPYHELVKRTRALEIDTSHFRGCGWARGETEATNPVVARTSARNRIPNEQVFVSNAPPLSGRALTKRLLTLGWSYCCGWCGITEWRGKPLVLHLDHVNGIHDDNRFENLRLLCPCHSQTATYSNRRR